jgi:hypothetical protein
MKRERNREDCRTSFAVTLRDALRRHRKRTGESAREVCEKIGLGEKGYRWLRKISSKGISHVRTDRRDDLQRICDHIGMNPSWLFAVGLTRTEEASTDFAKVAAIGIAEAARRSGTPVDHWHQIGKQFSKDLEEVVSVFLHKLTGEFNRHLASELAEEVRQENVAEYKRKFDEQAAADKALWIELTADWGGGATPPAFPVMREQIQRHNYYRTGEETEIHKDTWKVRPLTDKPTAAIVLFQRIWHRMGLMLSNGFLVG